MSTPDRPKQDKELGLAKERVGGRFVTTYDPDMALKILERVAQGETINQICKSGSGFCHPVTFKRWVVNNPELAKALSAARQLSAMSLEEEALDAAREIKSKQRDGTQVRAFEVLLQQLRWSAERRDPAQFGTKAPVSVKVPITINTTLALGSAESAQADTKNIYNLAAKLQRSVDTAVQDAEFTEISKPLVEGTPVHAKKPKTASDD